MTRPAPQATPPAACDLCGGFGVLDMPDGQVFCPCPPPRPPLLSVTLTCPDCGQAIERCGCRFTFDDDEVRDG